MWRYHPSVRLPQWLSSEESACSTEDPGSIPSSGRSPGEGNGNPLQYSCLENSMNRRTSSMGLQRFRHNWDTNTFTFFQVRGRSATLVRLTPERCKITSGEGACLPLSQHFPVILRKLNPKPRKDQGNKTATDGNQRDWESPWRWQLESHSFPHLPNQSLLQVFECDKTLVCKSL